MIESLFEEKKDSSAFKPKRGFFQKKMEILEQNSLKIDLFECQDLEELHSEVSNFLKKNFNMEIECLSKIPLDQSFLSFLENSNLVLNSNQYSSLLSAYENLQVFSENINPTLQNEFFSLAVSALLKSKNFFKNKFLDKQTNEHLDLIKKTIGQNIKSQNLISLSKVVHLVKNMSLIEPVFKLEGVLCEEIKMELNNFMVDENLEKLKNLINSYTSVLISLLHQNLNLTYENLKDASENEIQLLINDDNHLLLNSLNSGNVMRCIMSFIENNNRELDEFIIKDILEMHNNLMTICKKFLISHPFFSSKKEIVDCLPNEEWKSLLSKIDLEAKEKNLRESDLLLKRSYLINHLIPSDCLVYNYIFASSEKVWKNDLNYLIDADQNINALADFVTHLPEEYSVMVELSLLLSTEGNLFLKDFQEEKKKIRQIAFEIEQLMKPSSSLLSTEQRLEIIEWYMKFLNNAVNESFNSSSSITNELFNDFELRNSSYSSIELSTWKNLVNRSQKHFAQYSSFLKSLAQNAKSINFIYFKEDQLENLYDKFLNKYSFTNAHSIYLHLLNLASYKLSDMEIFLDCINDPLICGLNPIVTKKQSYYLILTLMKLNKDPINFKKIYSQFQLELNHCFYHDRILLELAFASKIDPTACQKIFDTHLLNPSYFESIKEKMKLFYVLYLQALMIEKNENPSTEISIEDLAERKNHYLNLIENSNPKSNTVIDSLRVDEFGKHSLNGNDLINSFDPKNQDQDNIFEQMGKIDLRPASVIDFKSVLSHVDSQRINLKIDNLMKSFENQDWKHIYEKDNQSSALNVVEQSYMISDKEFWRKYRLYIDSDIEDILEIRRDYRNILLKYYNENIKKMNVGKISTGYMDTVKKFYLEQNPKKLSKLGKNYLIKESKELILNEVLGLEKSVYPESIEEMASEAGDMNTALLLNHNNDNFENKNFELDQSLQIFNSKENVENWEIIEKIQHYTDKQMFMLLYRSAKGEEFEEKITLSEREKDLVLEIGEKYFGIMKRKEMFSKLGETTKNVLSVRTFQTKIFESLSLFEFSSKIKSLNKEMDKSEIQKYFHILLNKVGSNESPLIQQFISKWKLRPLLNSKNLKSFYISDIVSILEDKLNSHESGKELFEVYCQKNKEIFNGKNVLISLYQPNQFSANSNLTEKINLFEFLDDLEGLINTVNKIICHNSVINDINNVFKNEKKSISSILNIVDNLMIPLIPQKDIFQTDLKKELLRSINDDEKDLRSYVVNNEEEYKLERILSGREKEEKVLEIKRKVFNLHMMKKRIENQIENMKNDFNKMKSILDQKKSELEQKSELNSSENQELENLKNLLNNFSIENAVKYPYEFIYGIDKFKNLFQELTWIKEYEEWRDKKEGTFFFKEIDSYGSYRELRENQLLNKIGAQKYLVQEIGVINFFKNPKDYRKIELELQSQISKTVSPIDVAQTIITKLMDQKTFKEYIETNVEIDNNDVQDIEIDQTEGNETHQKEVLEGTVENNDPKEINTIKIKREIQLLNMKIRLIEEDYKNLFIDEEIKKMNQMIRLENYVNSLGEKGHFISRENYKYLLEKFDISENQKNKQLKLIPNKTSDFLLDYFTDKERKHLFAKSRLMTDYLIRFDPDFRKKYLRNLTIKEMNDTFIPEEKKKANAAKLIISDIHPEYFSSDNKSIIVRLMENFIQKEIPSDFMVKENIVEIDNLENYIDNNVEKIAVYIEKQVVNEIIKKRKEKQTIKIEELSYSLNLKDYMTKKNSYSNEECEIIYNLFNPLSNSYSQDLPLIKGNWYSNSENLSKESFVEALQSSTFKNENLITDFILSSLQKINNLESNDPKLIQLIDAVFSLKNKKINDQNFDIFESTNLNEANKDFLSQIINDNSMDILFKKQENSNNEILSEEKIKEMVSEEKGSEIKQAILESEENLKMNEKLFELVEKLELDDIGIDQNFKESMKELIEEKKKKIFSKKKEFEIYKMNKEDFLKETKLPLEELEKEIETPTFSNLMTLNRNQIETNLAEQLVMIGMHEDLYSSKKFIRNGINEDYFKFTKYNFDNSHNFESSVEYMLSNDGVFNIKQESEEVRKKIDEIYHPISLNSLSMHRIMKIASKEEREIIDGYMKKNKNHHLLEKKNKVLEEANEAIRNKIILINSNKELQKREMPEVEIPKNIISDENIEKFINVLATSMDYKLKDDRALKLIVKEMLKSLYVQNFHYSNIPTIDYILEKLDMENDPTFNFKKMIISNEYLENLYLTGKITKEEFDGKYFK